MRTTTIAVPDVFETAGNGVIRRAAVIGTGFPGSEHQSIGLVKALGLADSYVLYRVTRSRRGVNDWFHWLPLSFHKRLEYILRQIHWFAAALALTRSRTAGTVFNENRMVGGGNGLASILEVDVKQIVSRAREAYETDGPLLVVACGRETISIASSIKRLGAESTFVIQVQHPRSHLERFDLVITPRHDYFALTPQAQEQVPRLLRRWITPHEPPDEHVVLTLGALHHVDFTALRNAANIWHDEFAFVSKPLLVVNIGWPTRNCRYGSELAQQLVKRLLGVISTCGSVRISFSARTPEEVSKVIIKDLVDHPKVYIWNGQEPNPYLGNLAWGDAFVVTADSVSMLSEACSTGKPVYVIGSEECKWKLSEFLKSLKEKGVLRPFTGSEDMSQSWSYPPLNDTLEAARQVREALAKRGLRIHS